MAVSGGSAGGGSLRLMSCVRETSPADVVDTEETRHEPKKRRFHPFRGLRRMFRRKTRTAVEVETLGNSDAQSLEARSQSASQLLDDNTRRRSGGNLQSSGLSVSHDSIFSPEQQSADSGSELESTSSLSIQRLISHSGIRAELVDAVRRRRGRDDDPSDEEEEDLGLPRSPCSNSPTTADVLFEKVLKETANKSSHSTCSDGSLLSMGSSEMDEDSYGQSSRHSSKLSLQDKKNLVNSDVSPSHGIQSTHGVTQLEVGVDQVMTTPLSHSAAKHKMAVKPKRTHGAPRRRRFSQIGGGSLPVTPEVNEDGSHSGRSMTPEVETNDTILAQSGDADAVATPACNLSMIQPSATQLKSASLPPGLAPTLNNWNDSSSPVKLSRSRSSATNRQLDSNSSILEKDENIEVQLNKKEDMSFFGRLLSRRSGKKKKSFDEKDNCVATPAPLELPQKRMDEKGRYIHEVSKLSRSHPAARQRVEPINIPSECPSSVTRMQVSYSAPTPPLSPELKKSHSIKDDHLTFKQPNNRVIPLNSDDLMYQRKSLVKKSHSFRSEKDSDDVPQFTSLVPDGLISLPFNIQNNNENKKSNEFADDNKEIQKLKSEITANNEGEDENNFGSILNINDCKSNLGVLNKCLVQDVTNSSNLIMEMNDSLTAISDKKESMQTGVGVYITSSTACSISDIEEIASTKHDTHEVFIKRHSRSLLTSINPESIGVENMEVIPQRSSDSVESISHQISIPVNTSVVNIIKDNSSADQQKFVDSDSIVKEENVIDVSTIYGEINSANFQINSKDNKESIFSSSHKTVISSENSEIYNIKSENANIKPPEPKSRSHSQLPSDEFSLSSLSSSSFVPVPAPRLSKRDSLHATKQSAPIVPEFLKVQLNHIESKPQTTNLVLSKISSDYDKTDDQESVEVCSSEPKTNEVLNGQGDIYNDCDLKSLEEVEVKQDHIMASSVIKAQVPHVTNLTSKPNENIVRVTESIQKRSLSSIPQQQSQPIPNPRYSIVSITASGNSSDTSYPSEMKSENQIVRKKSIVKDLNGSITEKTFSSSDKSSLSNDYNKNESESSSVKNILRRKSFNKEMYQDDKSLTSINSSSQFANGSDQMADLPNIIDETIPKVVLRQKPIVNDIIIVETQQKNRKSSPETLQPTPLRNSVSGDKCFSNEINNKYNNRKSGDENIKEKYRNSFGSCDTLLSQDSSSSSEVVYRRKSLTSREVISKQKDKDDEPELLKVFARRSLKIKDTDINLQSNDLDIINTDGSSSNNTKSRDSDKENECGDSPPEERKKIKDSFMESKTENISESSVPCINGKINSRMQRSFSVHTEEINTNVNVLSSNHKENQNSYEKRQRSRTFPDNQKIIEPPTADAVSLSNQQQKSLINNIFRENEVEVVKKQNLVMLTSNNENSTEGGDVPLFKRIRQRKEEWEKRAQMAMNRSHP